APVRCRGGTAGRNRGASARAPRPGSAAAEGRTAAGAHRVTLPARRVRAGRGTDTRVHRRGGRLPDRVVAPSGRPGGRGSAALVSLSACPQSRALSVLPRARRLHAGGELARSAGAGRRRRGDRATDGGPGR